MCVLQKREQKSFGSFNRKFIMFVVFRCVDCHRTENGFITALTSPSTSPFIAQIPSERESVNLEGRLQRGSTSLIVKALYSLEQDCELISPPSSSGLVYIGDERERDLSAIYDLGEKIPLLNGIPSRHLLLVCFYVRAADLS